MQTVRPYHLPILFASLTVGCSTCSNDDASTAPVSSLGSTRPFETGERVVAEVARAAFLEGTVAIVERDQLTIKEQASGETRDVDAANVYRLDNAPKKDWKPSDLAICHMGNHRWQGCRVQGVTGNDVSVINEKGEEGSIALAAMLVPTAVTKLNLEHTFARIDKAKAFAEGVLGAGSPYRPVGWQPRTGESVIARSGGNYVSALVHETRSSLILVQLLGRGEKPQAISPEDAWPEPPVDASVSVGGYACLRPPTGEHVWRLVRIESNQDGKVQIMTSTGEEKTVSEGDLLPFESRRTP